MRARTASIAAIAAALVPAAPARAQDVARLPLGSAIQDLVAAPDGGAWVDYAPPAGRDRIGRISPAGGFRTAASGPLTDGQLGLDGHAWFRTSERGFARVDADLRFARSTLPRSFIGPFAIGPDATLWTPTYDDRMAHVSAAGVASYTPAPLPACTTPGSEQSELGEMVRAADGAMWISDFGCNRLLRVTPAATTAIGVDVTAFASLTPDAAGGVWLGLGDEGAVANVDSSGMVRTLQLALGEPTDIAVGLDGAAWFAHGGCRLTRVDAGGGIAQLEAPIVTHELAADASGRLLLAGRTRLARLTPGAPAGSCDDEGPVVRIRPTGRRISLAALRRGIRVSVRERAELIVVALHYPRGDLEDVQFTLREARHRRTRGAATVRYRPTAERLRRYARRLAGGGRPRLVLSVGATDADGNETQVQRTLRVTR